MASEILINRLYQMIDEIARLGGEQERTSIVPGILVADASPNDLPTGYIKIVNPRDGTYVPCLTVNGLVVSDNDLVNVLFTKGTEPIALSQSAGSPSSSVKVSELWDSNFGAVAWQTNATGDLSAVGAYDLTTIGDLTGVNINVADDVVHSGDSDTLRSFTDDAITDQAGGVVMLRLTETAQDLVEIGDVAGTGDVDVDLNNGVLFLDGLTDDLTLTGGDYISDQATRAVEHDFALHDSANDLGISSHFLDNDSSFPAGWTQADAAGYTDTFSRYSYWLLLGSSGETSWDYRRQTSIDLENDIAPGATVTVLIGPLMWRDAAFTANVNYYLGLYRDNAGSIDTATYARIRLRFDSAASAWKIVGEEADGSAGHTGTEVTLNAAPLNQPIYVAVTLNNAASKSIQCYWGKINDFALQTLLFSQSPTTAPTWGTFWVRFHMSRGAGSADRILIGSVDAQGL